MPLTARSQRLSKAIVKAASHPVRVIAFGMMADRAASPNEIAEKLEVDTSTVNYHVTELEKLGLVELVEERQRRGFTEHFYRCIRRPMFTDREWAKLPLDDREPFTTWILQVILIDISRALVDGVFDRRDDRHLSRTPLVVDEEGWRELVQIHAETLYRTMEVQARSQERLIAAGEAAKPINVQSVIVLHEAAAPA